jgi:hypothetical protein
MGNEGRRLFPGIDLASHAFLLPATPSTEMILFAEECLSSRFRRYQGGDLRHNTPGLL